MSAAATGTSPDAPLLEHELRRDGRIVLKLRAYASSGGFTVESEVHPLNQPPGGDPILRPFAFSTLDQARRFTDEALVAFEYLNCTATDPADAVAA